MGSVAQKRKTAEGIRQLRRAVMASSLPPGERHLLHVLIDYYPNIHPAVATMAAQTGSSTRSIKRLLGSLLKKGFLETNDHRAGGLRRSTHYHVGSALLDLAETVTPCHPLHEETVTPCHPSDTERVPNEHERVPNETANGAICDTEQCHPVTQSRNEVEREVEKEVGALRAVVCVQDDTTFAADTDNKNADAVIAAFSAAWTHHYGEAYLPVLADPGHASRLAASYSLSDLHGRLDAYFATTDNYIRKAGHPFALFATQIANFTARKADKTPSEEDTRNFMAPLRKRFDRRAIA
jgi:hypothetical protein